MLTPVFISSIKVYVNLLKSHSPSASTAKESRSHTCNSLCTQIEEIIRVLQLTSADDDDPEADDAAAIKRCLVSN